MLKTPFKTLKDGCKIYGNNHLIPLVYFWELTEKEKKEFDYINNPDDNFLGFRYKENVYDLGDCMRIDDNSPFKGLADGYYSDSFFSGILVKLTEDSDFIKAYTYIS
jgi:hypothetical protein